MSNDNKEKSSTKPDQKEEQHAHFKRIHHDAKRINPGPPALYCLNTERTYIYGTDKMVRQWTYGRRDRNKQNKVILLVGETGAGKTTMINTIINYFLGVKFEDQEFYQITEEGEHEDQTRSQTSEITVYEVFVEENPTSLTIIDTPGYGDTDLGQGYEKDRDISEYLRRLFSDEHGIHYIDRVCFVMKASQNRLSGKEHYIFHSALSLFGRDIEKNIVFLLTQSDGLPPTDALNGIKKAEIPCRRDEDNEPVYFLFNNQQKVKRGKRHERALKQAWEMGEESMKEFFTLLDENNRKSVQMTVDVLNERIRLEACVCNLKDRIYEKELKTNELNQIQEALRMNRDKIEKCENFKFTVKKSFKEKVLIENKSKNNRNATCCNVCEENCHEFDCSRAINAKWCKVIQKKHCTVCKGKCHYNKHIRENKKYVTKTNSVVMTFDELKQEYERTCEKPEISFDKTKFENIKKEHESDMKASENKTEIEEKLNSDLEKMKNEKSILLDEAYMTIMSLSKIALKADSAFTLQHLDFLIPRLKEEGKYEWIRNLEDLRGAEKELKNDGALQHVMNFTGRKFNRLVNYLSGSNK